MTMGDDGNLEMLASDVELTCGMLLPAKLLVVYLCRPLNGVILAIVWLSALIVPRELDRGGLGDLPVSHLASVSSPAKLYNMNSSNKDTTRREFGSPSQFPGDSVRAPRRLTPSGESCQEQVVGHLFTAVETSDAPIIIESSKVSSISMESMASTDAVAPRGEKRGRKPKGSNVPGSRSLSKMGANRMDYNDDVLDRMDFLKITKRDHQVGKRRKLQECPLDDALSYRQKAEVDEITYLLCESAPRGQIRVRKRHKLEREITTLKRQMKAIQVDRDSLRDESGPSREFHTIREIEYIPPVHRPSLRGISRRIPENSTVRRKLVDKEERIIASSMANENEDPRGRKINSRDWLPSSDPDKGEAWRTVPERRKKKRRKKGKEIISEKGDDIS
ncbi:hypothetical protein G5I_11975 [Acromyrmex echinatior]|uniref:Uncharacterized protein n=1 Tax=Acromyrmex echinatior TaxID=103372 RepID=F4X118_ACREC|nr:hypothetical protein G5I_11975 [Acromyrmex echinatior]